METYLVGGAVRDELLGLPVTEHDYVVVGATPEEMVGRGFHPVGRDFPVFIEPGTGAEYALARTERKTAPGYRGFSFHAAPDVTLEQDLVRRDLTINAMARAEDGRLIDPYGGRDDLEQRRLRHVSPAFVEDPLRVLRVARFAARFAPLGFEIAPETLALMQTLARSGELDHLTPERVWREVERALATAAPKCFFDVLRRVEALSHLFPPLGGLPPEHPAFRSLEAPGDDPTGVSWIALVAATVRDQRRLPRADDAMDDPEAGRRGRDFCDMLRTPREERDGALALARVFAPLTLPPGISAAAVLRAAELADAARRPRRLQRLAAATARLLWALDADAGHRGRVARTLAELPAVMQVDVSDLSAAGLAGRSMAEAVRKRRLARCEALLARMGDDD